MRRLLLRKPVWGALGLALVAVLVVSVMTLTGGGDRAEAAVIPPDCEGGGIAQTLNRTPAVAHVGDTITYEITVFNGPFPPSCQITEIETTFTTPDGASEVLPVPSTLNPGESSATFVRTYVIAAGDVQPDDSVTAELYSEGKLQDSPIGSTDTWDYDEAITTVVEPCIDVTKTADPTTSKAGDSVDYTIEVCNCGDVDLENITVDDDLLGDLSTSYADTLAPGACESHVFPRTVLETDPDPLVNTVTVQANPEEFTDVVSAEASAEVDLVHPDFEISKECSPDPVTVGDTITWTVTLTNTGDVTLIIEVDDPTAGISETITLAAGASETITRSRTVTDADVPPITNTVTATATLDPALGLPNEFVKTAEDSCGIEGAPCIEVTKEADPFSKAGDSVDYTIEVCNCGDVDLENITVDDDLLGDLSDSYADTLAPDACESHVFPYTVLATDPDPLVNTVTVQANPEGLTDVVSAEASAEVDLVHPDFEISKECSPKMVNVGDTITWTVTVTNTGDVTLIIEVDDPTAGISETITLAAGASETITRSRTVTDADLPEISNTVAATATLDPALGLDNVIERSAADSCGMVTPTPSPTPTALPVVETPAPTPTVVPVAPPPSGGGALGPGAGIPLWTVLFLSGAAALVSAAVLVIRGRHWRVD